jgi:hypothetical protein
MRKFFDELKSNLDVETVAAEAAAAIAEQDSTAPKLSDDDLSQIAGEDFLWKKILGNNNKTKSLLCFFLLPLMFLLGVLFTNGSLV